MTHQDDFDLNEFLAKETIPEDLPKNSHRESALEKLQREDEDLYNSLLLLDPLAEDEQTPADEIPDVAAVDLPDEQPSVDKPRRSFGRFVLDALGSVVPRIGDHPLEIARKVIFLAALVLLIGSVSYLFNEIVVIPTQYEKDMNVIRDLYTPDVPPVLTPEEEVFPYPEGMSDDFKKLYFRNPDVRGWLTFQSTDEATFLNIDYPVLYSGDNDYYLDHDFQRNYNKNGALYFDYRNVIEKDSQNKVLLIYGHNLASGQMFTRLNMLVTHSVHYARAASTIQLNTLYDKAEYKVFAVFITNVDAEDGPPFYFLRTQFSDDDDFLGYVAEMRARSIYDYNGVDVRADDQLLVLGTCNSKAKVGFDNGRTVVVARRVREGEDSKVKASTIVKNEDVIMPYAWYVANGRELHPYYIDADYTIPSVTVTEGSTTGTTDSSAGTGSQTAGSSATATPSQTTTATKPVTSTTTGSVSSTASAEDSTTSAGATTSTESETSSTTGSTETTTSTTSAETTTTTTSASTATSSSEETTTTSENDATTTTTETGSSEENTNV